MSFVRKMLLPVLVVLALLGVVYYRYSVHKKVVQQEQTQSAAIVPTVDSKTIFAFLGAPGSGKGTLAKQAIGELNFMSVSTGDLCRAEVASGSEKGKMIAEYMKGGLVPDEVITQMLEGWLSKNAGQAPIILDGYPRTQAQAEKLAQLLKEKFSDHAFRVVYLVISDEEEVVQRISSRLVCEQCKAVTNVSQLKNPSNLVCPRCDGKLVRRDDDKEKIVRERLKTFAKNNGEIVDYYKSVGTPVLELVVSHRTPEEVFENFKQLVMVPVQK
jgi:adenylate kinase